MDDGNCEKGCSDGTGSIHTFALILVTAPDSPSSSNLVLPLAAGDLFQANLMPLLPPYLYSNSRGTTYRWCKLANISQERQKNEED